MIPGSFHLLKELPYTAGGKADLTRLKKMAEEGCQDEIQKAEAPALRTEPLHQAEPDLEGRPAAEEVSQDENPEKDEDSLDTVEDILKIWEEVLGRKDLQPDESFFDQGGTSLGVLTALSHYFNRHIKMSIEEFYRYPTARAQAKLLGLGEKESRGGDSAAKAGEMPRHVPAYSGVGSELPETVFVTGATGFFGAHLVQALLAGGVRKVICLVRGSESRLYEALAWYFGAGWTAGAAGRIEAVSGDITLPFMGMQEEEYERLASRIQAVYHSAADVRHYTSDEASFMDSNLKGTREAIIWHSEQGRCCIICLL